MPIFVVKAVQRSADGLKSAHVADKWPIEVATLDEAKVFADRTPTAGWVDADTFEIVDEAGRTLACRTMQPHVDWKDEPDEPSADAED